MSTFRKDFDEAIEIHNTSNSTSIHHLISHMSKKHRDVSKHRIVRSLAKKRYRKIKNSGDSSYPKNIYIDPLFVYDFLLQDREAIKKDSSLLPNTKDNILKDNLELIYAFSIKFIKIYKTPLIPCNRKSKKEYTLYRIRIKFQPNPRKDSKKDPETDPQVILINTCNLIDKMNEGKDKIETLESYGSYIIITTMNKKFAKSIYKTLLHPYTTLWNESKNFESTTISFKLSYEHEPGDSNYESVRERFLAYLESEYPPK